VWGVIIVVATTPIVATLGVGTPIHATPIVATLICSIIILLVAAINK